MFCDFRRGWFGRLGLADKATIEFGMKMTNWLLKIISLKPKTSTSNDVHLCWKKNLLDLRSLQKFHPAKWVSEWSTLWDKYLAAPPGINSRHNATFRNSLSHSDVHNLVGEKSPKLWMKKRCGNRMTSSRWLVLLCLLKDLTAEASMSSGRSEEEASISFPCPQKVLYLPGWEILTNRRHIVPTYKT